jgi:D-beta-D-heptose 7-phosphate kinase/D-beta-D-heptose 1-phosphate adenosyltransferase
MNILVIGDIMLDINYNASINRNAPEANIPIYDVTNINYILGGAANVVQNLQNLETNVELISVIGYDFFGKKIKNLLDSKNIKSLLIIDENRKTTQKNRIFNNNILTTRFDIEDKDDISTELEDIIFDYVVQKKEKIDAIIISDYDKGVITITLCQKIINYSNQHNIYTFVDPKIKCVEKYKNCFCFKPNLHEGQIITKENDIDNILCHLQNIIHSSHIILTCGEKGIYIDKKENNICHDNKINVIDVTGAGDIVLSIITYIFLQNKDLQLATKVANYVAGKSVQCIGNYNVSKNDIQEYFDREKFQKQTQNQVKQNKIIYETEIEKIKELSKNENIVFTNGCFDIIHSAHIQNLQFAKKQGDILVVGLNSDESIKQLKGPTRPINVEEERATLLSLFDFVDYVIIFNDNTPLSIIKLLTPFTIVKGGDYTKEQIIGSEYAKQVLLFDYIADKSSSIVINKILNK